MRKNTQQNTGSICTFCLPPIQLTYFYISDAKQKITLALETKENNPFGLKFGKKKQIKDTVNTSCSYHVHAQRQRHHITQPEKTPN